MVQKETYFESHDMTELFLYRWMPSGQIESITQPRAVVHIVHGMAEHALRYRPLAEKLTKAGIEVWAADQRGFGKTADLNVNTKSNGGLLGHCSDGYSFEKVIQDIYALNTGIRKTVNVPVFLLGHSWGSLLVQNYMEDFSDKPFPDKPLINGCILSGTKGPGDITVKAGLPFLVFLALLRGQRSRSHLVRAMGDGKYNKPFKPSKTAFDWLSRNEEEVNKYLSDPLCGKLCSIGFYRDIAKMMAYIHKPESLEKINKNIPVYVLSGSADPVGDMGAGPTALVNIYRDLGIKDLEFVLYPGARHELFNETNREEVMENILSWINKRC